MTERQSLFSALEDEVMAAQVWADSFPRIETPADAHYTGVAINQWLREAIEPFVKLLEKHRVGVS